MVNLRGILIPFCNFIFRRVDAVLHFLFGLRLWTAPWLDPWEGVLLRGLNAGYGLLNR